MSPTQESAIKVVPSIKEVFGIYPELTEPLKQNNIHSVAATMLLPKEVLAKMERFSVKKVNLVSTALSDFDLAQLELNQNVRRFVEDQFGCLEEAPIGVLDVVTLPTMKSSKQEHSPLTLLSFFEDYEPHMTVLDLLRMSEWSIRQQVAGKFWFGPVYEPLVEDITEVNRRLSWWDENFHIPLDVHRKKHLRALNG